ncbi:MAG TPA: tRNA uridine-5-carboxymethylaminomethyl(34) synthesis GTPase MnmE [Opitutaceae bacterium]
MDRSIETVAALSTPAGTSALAVVRASGPACVKLGQDIFGKVLRHSRAVHCDYRDLEGRVVDDVVVVFFEGPRSYTGEDTLEISAHGNPLIAQRILEDLFARGCRAAEPGEFTRRAFSNGRLDLSQAEAVIDLIEARSARALEAANQQLRGSLGRHMAKLTDGLLMILARIEAYIDFPEEDLPTEDRKIVIDSLEETLRGTKRLLATQHYGDLLRDGIKTVIVGAPNAGKSSLLNALVGQERALVSAEPGTTRDFIEERVILGPHCIRLIDTAGLRAAEGAIEKLGIQKTVERAAEADLFLWVVDGSAALRDGEPKWPAELGQMPGGEKIILVLNKTDLLSEAEQTTLRAKQPYPVQAGEKAPANKPAIALVSALAGTGLDELVGAVVIRAESFNLGHGEETIAINARHADALRRAEHALTRAQEGLGQQGEIELISSDIREGLNALGEIAGRIDNERMLDHLFSTFCIGK